MHREHRIVTLTDRLQILADIAHHNINIFEGPRYELDDEETIAENNEIMSKVPFAVVGANNEVTNADGRKVRGRRYPWGVIEVDNEEHCDFVRLKDAVFSEWRAELRETSREQWYEGWRTSRLKQRDGGAPSGARAASIRRIVS